MTELQLTARIMKAIRTRYPSVYVQRVSERFLSGIPDIRIILDGLSGDIEVKLPGKKTTGIQDKVLEWIACAGGACVVVTSVDEALDFIRELQITALQRRMQ